MFGALDNGYSIITWNPFAAEETSFAILRLKAIKYL